jgi:hypothetical protein
MPHYVDVRGISPDVFSILGYILLDENEEFEVYWHKSGIYVLAKHGKRLLYVEDDNDAAVLRSRKGIVAPPKQPEMPVQLGKPDGPTRSCH